MSSQIAELTYRLIERIDGERGVKLMPYRMAERLKVRLYDYIR